MRRKLLIILYPLADIVLANLAFLMALAFRFDDLIPAEYWSSYLLLVPIISLVTLLVYYLTGFYRRLWQYASIRELYMILKGVTIACLIVVGLVYLCIYPLGLIEPLPRSVYPVAWLLALIFTGMTRLWVRSWREYHHSRGAHDHPDGVPALPVKRLLIIGAGEAGVMVARELRKHPSLGLQPVGFVDDDPVKQGRYLMELPVLGARRDIQRVVKERGIEEILIAIPSAPGRLIREIVDICQTTGVKLKTLPGVYEVIDGKVSVTQLRQVQVEDLLGREPVRLDMEAIADYITGKTIMITGAGGSIGSELCRQIARFQPSVLVVLDNTENNLFEIEQELRERFPEQKIGVELADVRDEDRLKYIFTKYRPQVIFHAAAYKHVPMMERFPEHALTNNIVGTYNVALMAKRFQAETFILVSTDKAVRPTSVMGATKRAAELVVQQLNEECRQEGLATCLAAVRFGNVLGSRGSVLPTFKRQIAQGGPVTVTDPKMERYFMTIPEAVQLIIQAGQLAKGGEIFVLDMGEPVRIADMAADLIRLSGYEPGKDIEIIYTGIRPGEKLREELFSQREEMAATKHERIYVYQNELAAHSGLIGNIKAVVLNAVKENAVVDLLARLVPEYQGHRELANEQQVS